jgi:hypothetical protein
VCFGTPAMSHVPPRHLGSFGRHKRCLERQLGVTANLTKNPTVVAELNFLVVALGVFIGTRLAAIDKKFLNRTKL